MQWRVHNAPEKKSTKSIRRSRDPYKKKMGKHSNSNDGHEDCKSNIATQIAKLLIISLLLCPKAKPDYWHLLRNSIYAV